MTSGKRGSYRTGLARRDQILEVALECFIMSGYRATSLRDIARAAGISHPALLRHFASKAEILTGVIRRLDESNGAWWDQDPAEALATFAPEEAARRGEATPGWIELFTALLGEATSPAHPGHELMRTRINVQREFGRRALSPLAPDAPSAVVEAAHIGAAWNGLQILSLYFPGEINIPAHLTEYSKMVEAQGIPPLKPTVTPTSTAPAAPSDEPRDRILASATLLYGIHGYYETSLKAVAQDAGVSKAALIHLFPTKSSVLSAALEEVISPAGVSNDDWLRTLAERPRYVTAAEIVLLCEAIVPGHPAHDFMAGRLSQGLAETAAQLSADTPGRRRAQAEWMVALCLGLVIHSFYDPSGFDLSVAVRSYLDRAHAPLSHSATPTS